MRVVIVSDDEAPIVLDAVEKNILVEGDDLTFYDEVEGRTPVNVNDVMEIRITKDQR